MIFKIVCKDEIHRIRNKITSFKELVELIDSRFAQKLNNMYCCEYQDTDGDRVRVNCEEDFQILLEELAGSKTCKIYVKEDLNSTMEPSYVEEKEIESFEDLSEEVEVTEEKVQQPTTVLPEENSVLQKIENSVLKSVTQVNTDQLMDLFNIEKQHYKEVMRWVTTKKTNDMEDLVNFYMNEMINKFPAEEVIEEVPEQEEVVEEVPVVEVKEVVIEDEQEEVVEIEEKVEEPEQTILLKDVEEKPVEEVEEIEAVIQDKSEESEEKEDESLKPRLDWTREQWRDWKTSKKDWTKEDWTQWGKVWWAQFTENECKNWNENMHGEWLKNVKGNEGKKCFWANKEEYIVKKDEEKEAKGKCFKNWKKGCWAKKRKWFNKKFENKFDESIRSALPQIAVQVAAILRNENTNNEGFAPLRDQKVQEEQHKVVHKGYVCDGCGMNPIVGVCYKSSVQDNFDFCEKCEATIPHPHPFLKLKTPEQRPHAIFTVINEENQPKMQQGENLKEMFTRAKSLFSGFCKTKQGQDMCSFMKNLKQNMQQKCKSRCPYMQKKQQEAKKEEPKVVVEEPKVVVETPQVVEEEKPESNIKVVDVDPVTLSNTQQLMEIFNINDDGKDGLMKWVQAKGDRTIDRLVNLYMEEMYGKF